MDRAGSPTTSNRNQQDGIRTGALTATNLRGPSLLMCGPAFLSSFQWEQSRSRGMSDGMIAE